MTSIPKLLKLKDYITLTGTALGVIALVCATFGSIAFISVGFMLVTLTLGTDMLDGYIARKTGTVNKIGIELDSLSDSLTFGIVPAILTYQAFKTGEIYDVVLIIGCVCFIFGAILRLARFNISTEDPGYTGVPTPISALLLLAFFYANYFYAHALGSTSFARISYYLIPLILILIGWFNITTHISFGEKSRNVYILVLIIAPVIPIIAIIGIMNPDFLISLIVSIFFFGSFLFAIIYIFIGFFIKLKKKKN